MSMVHEIFDNGCTRLGTHDDEAYKAFCVAKFVAAGLVRVTIFASAPAPTFPPDAKVAHTHAVRWVAEHTPTGTAPAAAANAP